MVRPPRRKGWGRNLSLETEKNVVKLLFFDTSCFRWNVLDVAVVVGQEDALCLAHLLDDLDCLASPLEHLDPVLGLVDNRETFLLILQRLPSDGETLLDYLSSSATSRKGDYALLQVFFKFAWN